jgi:hypothetical protein
LEKEKLSNDINKIENDFINSRHEINMLSNELYKETLIRNAANKNAE